jgi:nitrogen fixation protein FixH
VHSYTKRNNQDKGPDFLKSTVASKLISPNTYHATESFNKTQTYKVKFFSGKGKGKSLVDEAIKRSLATPGAGHYDIKNIERAYTKITMGASRGWK